MFVLSNPTRRIRRFGVPDSIYGEEVASWVTLKAGKSVTTDDLATHCAAQLPDAKRPKQIEIVDDIPKNDRGKIDRNAARATWEETEQEASGNG